MVERYIIAEVLETKTNKQDDWYKHKLGKEVLIESSRLKLGTAVRAFYLDGRVMYSTTVNDIEKDDTGIWITTYNRKYRFDKILK